MRIFQYSALTLLMSANSNALAPFHILPPIYACYISWIILKIIFPKKCLSDIKVYGMIQGSYYSVAGNLHLHWSYYVTQFVCEKWTTISWCLYHYVQICITFSRLKPRFWLNLKVRRKWVHHLTHNIILNCHWQSDGDDHTFH